MPRGRDVAGMAQMKAPQGPYSDPRDSKLQRPIRRVFYIAEGRESVTTRKLLEYAYPQADMLGERRPLHLRIGRSRSLGQSK
jgi:hypothetical protein